MFRNVWWSRSLSETLSKIKFLLPFSSHRKTLKITLQWLNQRKFDGRTFIRLVSPEASQHCAFIGNTKMKCWSEIVFFFLTFNLIQLYFIQEVAKFRLIMEDKDKLLKIIILIYNTYIMWYYDTYNIIIYIYIYIRIYLYITYIFYIW